MRRRYEPDVVRLVIIAESPPASGHYFYNPSATSEWLFRALMQQLSFSPVNKESGLLEFQRRGWVLVDATYKPVNELPNGSKRDKIIIGDYQSFRDDLASLLPDRSAPLILIKENVCRLLEPRLKKDGFNVLNAGRVIYFPSHGRQNDFHRQFAAVLKSLR
jgi:hypothetical protein